METDTFFYRLFKELPQTVFELIGQPAAQAEAYRFDSVELKKALRIDGLLLPTKGNLPLVFVEVQFRLLATFYANLFAKVFCYLEENDPAQDWLAVAIFGSRSFEPKESGPYGELLASKRVRRIYLDEYPMPADPPPGLSILELVTAPQQKVEALVGRLRRRVETEFASTELGVTLIELLEEILIRRFSGLTRQEVRSMFQLEDLRKTKVWQEAQEETKAELVRKWLAKGKSAKEIATLLETSVREVRRLAKLPIE